MADLYFYREIRGMSNYLNTVTRRDKIEPNDSLVFNRASGATNQIAYNKFTEGLPTGIESVVAGTNVTVDNTDPKNPIVSSTGGGGGGSLANVIDATAGDYTLVPDSDNPVTVITMNADTGALTIPSGSFTVGSIYTVTNESLSDDMDIVVDLGVTVGNVTASSQISLSDEDSGTSFASFVNIGTNSWIVYGDVFGFA